MFHVEHAAWERSLLPVRRLEQGCQQLRAGLNLRR